MKVVLFCGGYGMRMRDGATPVPKPMAMIGDRPLLWHVMRYYAHFGHTEFVLCLGYGASHIKDYFLRYEETCSNDFVMHGSTGGIELLSSDLDSWKITFADTGRDSSIGERLLRVRKYVEGEDMFLANYADVLTDAPLPEMIDRFRQSNAVACLLAVPPQGSFHLVDVDDEHRIVGIRKSSDLPYRENGGYFLLRREIFDNLATDEDLVGDAFERLREQGRLLAHPYDGFWAPADTYKERAQLEELFVTGARPWALWDVDRGATPSRIPSPDPVSAPIVQLVDLEAR